MSREIPSHRLSVVRSRDNLPRPRKAAITRSSRLIASGKDGRQHAIDLLDAQHVPDAPAVDARRTPRKGSHANTRARTPLAGQTPKPSDGLEPSTPSLPFSGSNRRARSRTK